MKFKASILLLTCNLVTACSSFDRPPEESNFITATGALFTGRYEEQSKTLAQTLEQNKNELAKEEYRKGALQISQSHLANEIKSNRKELLDIEQKVSTIENKVKKRNFQTARATRKKQEILRQLIIINKKLKIAKSMKIKSERDIHQAKIKEKQLRKEVNFLNLNVDILF